MIPGAWPGSWLDAAAWAAALAAAGAAVASIPAARRGLPPSRPVVALLAVAAAVAWAALAFLASRFLAADLSYQYVFFYTAKDVEWPWRLAGTWAGREGSLLLWAAWLALAALAVALLHRRRPAADEGERRDRAWTLAILALVLAVFLGGVATQSAFQPTAENLLVGRPSGNGLNPTLKSGFILIHPPLTFAAYAVAAVPLAAGLGHLASGTGRWSAIAMPWTRLGWLLMTAALGLGALWAYYTLGFGGYWAWDPVEVANLLPWLAFTVVLHAQLHHARHGAYAAIGPFLGALPFLLTIFSTVSTRSGLWISVHAFTDPTDAFDPDAASRFLGILRAEPSLSFHVGVFLAALAAVLAAWCRRLALDHGRLVAFSRGAGAALAAFAAFAAVAPASAFSALLEAAWWATGGRAPGLGLLGIALLACLAAAAPLLLAPGGGDGARGAAEATPPRRRRPLAERIHLRSLAAYAVLALGLALLVLFLFHVASAQRGSTARFYEERFPFLALPLSLGLCVFLGHQAVGRRRSLALAAGALALGLAAWGVARGLGEWRLGQGLLLAVPAALACGLAFLRIRRAAAAPGTPRPVRRADALLLAAALLDLLFWLNPPAVRLGPLAWTPAWPAQAVLGGLALLATWGAVRQMAGALPPRASGPLHLLAGGLGGFYAAVPLAAASWLLRRRAPAGAVRPRQATDARVRARLHQAALYGVHLAVALALLGYAPSTYLKAESDVELAVGQAAAIGGFEVAFAGSRADAALGPAGTVWQDFEVVHGLARESATVSAPLRWEPAAGSHYPRPATLRAWTGDLYLDVTAVHVAQGPCLGPSHADGAWVEAYRAGSPSRVCAGDRIDAVRATAAALPGLGLLWLALALGVAAMAMLMATSARGPSAASAGTA